MASVKLYIPFCNSKENSKNTYCFPFNQIVKLFVPQTLSKVASCVQFFFSFYIIPSSLGGSGDLFKFLLIIIQGQCKRYIPASFDLKSCPAATPCLCLFHLHCPRFITV